MNLEQVKIGVAELVKGMYVCKLDRPWIETPFPFQGFFINEGRDIQLLQTYCNYVWIDLDRGVAPRAESRSGTRLWNVVSDSGRRIPRPAKLRIRRELYGRPKSFRRELRHASTHYRDLELAVNQAFQDLRVGKPLAVEKMRDSAASMVTSVIRNPDAFVWLSRLRLVHTQAYHHSVRSAIWATFFARHLGLAEDKLNDLALGVLLADIGKAKLSSQLLKKSRSLTAEELEKIRSHVQLGVEILEQSDDISERTLQVVATHHERFDGSGYPRHLVSDQIPLLGRIAGIVDSYDAMTSMRPYASTMTPAEALGFLFERRDRDFQAQLVDEFIQAVGIYPSGTVVELSTKEIGVIISHDFTNRLRPHIASVVDAGGRRYCESKLINLADRPTKDDGAPIKIKRSLCPDDYDIDFEAIHTHHMTSKWDWRKLLLG